MSRVAEGVKRTGRASLWLGLPPVGIYSSVRHGRRKSEDRLAAKIAAELNPKVDPIEAELERLKLEVKNGL